MPALGESIQKKRVGIVMPLGHQQGGAESLLLHLLGHGSQYFSIVCLFLQDGPLPVQAKALGYPTHVIAATRLSDPWNLLKSLGHIRRWAKRERLEAVLSWMPKAHLYVAPALAFSTGKTLWYQHGISSGQRMDRITTRLPADRVLCCSLASQQAQDRLAPLRPTAVCYPGVVFPSTGLETVAEARRQLGLDPDVRFVGMVARWERWKGVDVFLRAAMQVAAEEPSTSFFVVGGAHPRDPAYAAKIEAMAIASGLGQRLLLVGQRPSEEVPLWQASADLIVHPVTGTEPFGMAVAEAMGMGKAVIASNTGGLPEIIEDGVSGFLVPSGDAEVLAATIVQLLRDPVLLAATGTRAFLRGRSFSVQQFAARLDSLLCETLHQ